MEPAMCCYSGVVPVDFARLLLRISNVVARHYEVVGPVIKVVMGSLKRVRLLRILWTFGEGNC